ncbi:KH domain-containing protein [Arthroderma uncinatum]|uniref:KH domain-containing protein n=1 Tax=Arthroderma uncinatum TaxID=74035 RepID=UPI00144ADB06|nr:KH domain-containing protein [Arthroderma uncinatum]KAF3482986.1 KH domain-containing protein [Arthroderma uncinatum]
MHKISNFTGQARHGWERMTPTFGMSRPQQEAPNAQPFRRPQGPGQPPPQSHHQQHSPQQQQQPQQQQPQQQQQQQQQQPSQSVSPNPTSGASTPAGAVLSAPASIEPPTINVSFNIPFSSNLPGPDPADVLHSSPGAFQRWTFPEGTLEGTPIHRLPVHTQHVDSLRKLCRQMSESSGGRLEATVTSSEPKMASSMQRRHHGLVTNVCISGEADLVREMRATIYKETPIVLRSLTVDVDLDIVFHQDRESIRKIVLEHIDILANYTGADIFLLSPRVVDADSAIVPSYGYSSETSLERTFRIAIFSDAESAEHAKSRVLIMIDQILKRRVDLVKLELSTHFLVCGRTRKNIKMIEAATNTAIYFPPPFPRIYGYTPPGATRRCEDEVYITGCKQEEINVVKQKLRDLVNVLKVYVKEAIIPPEKIDSIILERLDKVQKVMEANGCFVLLPQLGSGVSAIRVQGTDVLHVERTIRELMTVAGQFYGASWWLMTDNPQMRAPSPADVRTMLSDICANSGADVTFDKLTFHIHGSDDSVKAAMMVIYQIPFVKRSTQHMKVKVELANEHKEFVSGKKNGKINKIMSQITGNVQIIFDGFNEYNFYIDVCSQHYEAVKQALHLVEQEMPASISFHVPDQYHKRIIGIGGQHIQRVMKKYSVFVKFSNAMDRGGAGKDDDDIRVENVICRTPARNAQNLELVKQEIMDMVEKVDAEFVSETVVVQRLYHRELIARMPEIDELEKKWNCKIDFPSTETASDFVTISGPEYQVPQAVDAFLGMVPQSHAMIFGISEELRAFFLTPEFSDGICRNLREQYEIELSLGPATFQAIANPESTKPLTEDTLEMRYTRNNSGGIKDVVDFLISRLVPYGLDATTVKGSIPRPKSDSFEDSLPFFDSKLLQHAPAPLVADSPIRANFATDDSTDRGSIFGRLRKPGSIASFSSFIGRKNQSSSPGSLFKHASSNASKASLVSMESRDSGYRNPWNDSGVNLAKDDMLNPSGGSGWPSRFDNKFPFGTGGAGSVSGGDMTPKHDLRASFDSGRPSTSNSYSAPIGPPR